MDSVSRSDTAVQPNLETTSREAARGYSFPHAAPVATTGAARTAGADQAVVSTPAVRPGAARAVQGGHYPYRPEIYHSYPIAPNNGRTDAQNRYRYEVLYHLDQAGLYDVARQYAQCQDPELFSWLVCPQDPDHFTEPRPHTDHLRICAECAHREHVRLIAQWKPMVEKAIARAPEYFKATHLVFTRSKALTDPDVGEHFAGHPGQVNAALSRYVASLRRVARYHVARDHYRADSSPRGAYRCRVALKALRDDKHARTLFFRIRANQKQNRGWWFNRIKKRLAAGDSLKQLAIGFIGGSEFGETNYRLHSHWMYYGPYLEHDVLKAIWQELTGDSVIYFRGDLTASESLTEVLKYATKLTELPPALVPTLYKVLKGHRRIRAYGLFQGLTTDDQDKPCECPVCQTRLALWSEDRYEREIILRTGNNSNVVLSGKDPPDPPPKQLTLGLAAPHKPPGYSE